MTFDLPTIWAGLIALSVLMYVILDGFDLGVGILFPFARSEKDRDVMMNSVAPVWDGNETWLILGGGGLFAVFPLAYAIVMPALYIPVIAMLLGLVFRGVAFEYRWRHPLQRPIWDFAFFGGSLIAAMMQGVILGALVQGIEVEGRAYAGGWWDWLTPFTLLTGVSVVAGYTLLGATWLVAKTTGTLQADAQRRAWLAGIATLIAILAVSIVTPLLQPDYWGRWFAMPAMRYSMIVPLLVGAMAFLLFSGLSAHRDVTPFLASLGLFVFSFCGLGVSFYPNIVPPSLTIHEAAAPDASLAFALWGAGILLPVIIAYTAYAYWVFRGKIDPEEGYH